MDRENKKTKYMALYLELKEKIESGKYLIGSLLPTEKQMMERYNVSRNTVRRAIFNLEMEGFVSVSPGKGTQVIKGHTNQETPSFQTPYDVTTVEKRGWENSNVGFSGSTIDVMQADTYLSEKLGIAPLSEVYRIQRLKFCGNIPFCYVVSYIDKEKLPGLEQSSGQVMWLNKHIYDHYHIAPIAAHEIVTVKAATFLEANLLRMEIGAPMMVVQRMAEYEQNLVEVTESFYNPAYFYISIKMKGRPDYLISADPSVI